VSHVNAVSFTILVVLFAVVTLVGFAAARWRRAEDMMHLYDWGLGGRGFGTFVSLFLLGGDLYTACSARRSRSTCSCSAESGSCRRSRPS
jgi:solute:Na+ symporter, SSS family